MKTPQQAAQSLRASLRRALSIHTHEPIKLRCGFWVNNKQCEAPVHYKCHAGYYCDEHFDLHLGYHEEEGVEF